MCVEGHFRIHSAAVHRGRKVSALYTALEGACMFQMQLCIYSLFYLKEIHDSIHAVMPITSRSMATALLMESGAHQVHQVQSHRMVRCASNAQQMQGPARRGNKKLVEASWLDAPKQGPTSRCVGAEVLANVLNSQIGRSRRDKAAAFALGLGQR